MNYRMIFSLLGNVLLLIAAVMLLPALVALYYAETAGFAILQSATVCGGAGLLLSLLRPKKHRRALHARDGFVMVSLAWIVLSLAGALPFRLSGAIPSYLDAVFETASGFTTTGSSILTAVESMPKCLLFWRSFSHWLGGMGVLVFMLAIVPLSGEGIYLLRAESAGPSVNKMLPKMRDSSITLYTLYFALSVLQYLTYRLGAWCGWGEISVFDSVCLTFGTAGTGGFAVRNDGLAGYSAYVQIVTTVYMLLFGVNFSLYFLLLRRKLRDVWRSSELRAYLLIVFCAITLITINLLTTGGYFRTIGETLRQSSFTVDSIITTTGYGTTDFSRWPEFSRVVLAILMIVGGCAGSTAGGMKVSRVLILCKTVRAELRRLLHPHSVEVMTMDGKRIGREVVHGAGAYLVLYLLLLLISVLLVSLDGFGTETTLSAVLTALNNIGPGLSGQIGPFGSFADFSALSKLVLTADMILGRLELFPVLLLLRPSTWYRH